MFLNLNPSTIKKQEQFHLIAKLIDLEFCDRELLKTID